MCCSLNSFQGKRISFYKRAQILVADFWGVMEDRGQGDTINIDWLTMFADYRVPQALVYFGALRYSDTLMQALTNGETGVCACVCLVLTDKLRYLKILVCDLSQGSCYVQATRGRLRSEVVRFGLWN